MLNKNGIIIVGSSASPETGSGISTYAKELALALVQLDFSVRYICPEGDSKKWFDLHDSIEALTFEPENNPNSQTSRIWNKIKSIDNLVGVINNDNIFLQALAPVITAPFVSIVHMLKTTIFSTAVLNHQFVDYVIVISNDMYFDVCARTDISKRKICLIYNGVVIDEKPVIDKFIEVRSKPLTLIAGGGYSNAKGGYLLLSLIKKLKGSSLHFNYVSFGEVPKGVMDVVKEDSRFKFHKRLERDEYLKVVKSGDIYLFPSKLEGCPMSLLEAMNYGLIPIAANGKGAMKEIVQHGVDGYILPFLNWENDAFEIIKFYSENPRKIIDVSKSSKKKITENFNNIKTATQIVALLKRSDGSSKFNIIDENINVYKWHRLPIPFVDKWKPSILARRLLFRFGIIRTHGVFKV